MKINYPQLEAQLQQKLAPIYLIAGEEAFLKQEALQLIRQQAKKAGFTDRLRVTADEQYQWDELYTTLFSPSLFQQKFLIECDFRDSLPSKTASDILKAYVENTSAQQLLVIHTNKIDDKIAKSAWYKAIDKIAITVTVWPINREQLPQWILQRARKYPLNLNLATANFLSDLVEGNVSAAAQALEKIYLYQPTTAIDEKLIHQIIHDESHYSLFDFIDYLLLGDTKQTLACLTNLHDEGVEPILVLWAITRELRILVDFYQQMQSGLRFEEICKKQRIFARHQQAVRKFLHQHQMQDCLQLLAQASEIDLILKGAKVGDPWQSLQWFCLRWTTAK